MDSQKAATNLNIKLVEGNVAPRYAEGTIELNIETAVITEKGMASDLPLIDFQITDDKGRVYFAALTGRVVLVLAAAIKGVNLRNHGVEEPQ